MPSLSLAAAQAQFAPDHAYFNTATYGLPPESAFAAFAAAAERSDREPVMYGDAAVEPELARLARAELDADSVPDGPVVVTSGSLDAIERVLVAHAGVAEAAVIGRADPKWQEVPVAYVVRRKGTAVDARTLEAHLLSQLARFKVPRDYVFVDALPRNAMGKVSRKEMHDLFPNRESPV